MKDVIWSAVGVLVIFVFGFFIGKYLVPPEFEFIERNITVPSVCEPCEIVQCPECITERTIEKIIEKPCPECRCLCKVSGAWEDNRTWWYADNKTVGYTS